MAMPDNTTQASESALVAYTEALEALAEAFYMAFGPEDPAVGRTVVLTRALAARGFPRDPDATSSGGAPDTTDMALAYTLPVPDSPPKDITSADLAKAA